MSTEESKAVVRQMVEGWKTGALDTAIAAYTPDFVYHNAAVVDMPGLPPGPDGMRQLMTATRTAFPDLRYTVEALIGEGDMVAVLYTWQGTHSGDLAGFPPTGRSVTTMGMIVCRVASGRIVEQWDVDDRLSVMQQLGLIPAPGTPGQ